MDKKFLYVLLSNDSGERLQLVNSPIGWDAQKFNLIRDLRYFGVFKKISVEFEFVGDGYRFMQDHYLRYGIDSNIILRCYKRVPGGYKFLVDGKINLVNFFDDRKTRKFKVDIVQSSFVQKFQNREDVKVNLFNNISIDRTPINATPTIPALFQGKTILFDSDFEGTYQTEPQKYHHIWPFFLVQNENPGVQEANATQLDEFPEELIKVENAHYVNNLSNDQTVSINWAVSFNVANRILFSSRVRHRVLLVDPDDTVADTLFEELIPATYFTPTFYEYNYTDTITVGPGQYIIFLCERLDNSNNALDFAEMEGGQSATVSYNSMSLTFRQESILADSTKLVLFPHEIFTNLIAQLTGRDNAVYSEFFGRTDLGYDEDGEGALLAITKGELLRGVPISETQFSTSLRDAFTSYSAVWNLGITIGQDTVTIEPKEDLFNSEISVDLGEVSELGVTPAGDFVFNSVIAGYPNNEYEKENGRDEFNTTVQYTNSVQSVKKELDLKSIYNGDGYGIEFARRLSVATTGSADSKYDNQIFFIDLVRDGDGYKTRRLEGIDYVAGIYSPETAMNLRIYPGQNLLRWERYLGIPLHRKSTQVYYFQTKDKNSDLELITPLGETNDGEDVNLSAPAYFLPEEKQFNSPITVDNLFAILDNPLGLIRYKYKGEDFFDYLFELDAENEKATGKWRMLSTKPSPVQIDEPVTGDFLKFGSGSNDYVNYDNVNDIVKYGDN